MTLELVLISRLIFNLNISKDQKTNLQACVSYNIKMSDNVDLAERYLKCKKKILKGKK
jgi:hypothetical protein